MNTMPTETKAETTDAADTANEPKRRESGAQKKNRLRERSPMAEQAPVKRGRVKPDGRNA